MMNKNATFENNGMTVSTESVILDLEEILRTINNFEDGGLLNRTVRAYYAGGTLCVDTPNGKNCLMLTMRDGTLPKEVRILLAKIYISAKTPTHAFYDYAIEYLKSQNVEFKPGCITLEPKKAYFIVMITPEGERQYLCQTGLFSQWNTTFDVTKMVLFENEKDVQIRIDAIKLSKLSENTFYRGSLRTDRNIYLVTEEKENAIQQTNN